MNLLYVDLNRRGEVHEGLMHAGLTWQREKIRKLVEAGGVGPALAPHSKQLIDSANPQICHDSHHFQILANPVTKWSRAWNLPASKHSHTSQPEFAIRVR
jgi:hypothetical protein